MPLQPGETFAGYTIVRLLGSGGMGEVYLAEHPRLPRRDALKLLPRDWSADAEYRARFNREADLASTLWHPHIVGVHDRGEYDGQLWISMDFVDGLDAARLLVERHPAGMAVDEVERIVTAVASALDCAHEQGLLHRDVKPSNVMLTHADSRGHRRIVLTDFGIARPIDDDDGLTATNMTIGTVAYSAPEQLMGEALDGRADQYSLAATAYHLIAGTRLFPHTNRAVVISHHLNAEPPKVSDAHPELAALDPVLARALAKRADERFNRCEDFARAFSTSAYAPEGNSVATYPSAEGEESEDATAAGPAALAETERVIDPKAQTKSAPAASKSAPPGLPVGNSKPVPLPSHRKRRPWIVGTVASAVLVVVASLLIWHPWHTREPAMEPVASPAATTTKSDSTPGISPPQFTHAPTITRSVPPPSSSHPADIAGMVVMLDPDLSGNEDKRPVPDGRGGTTSCQADGAKTTDGYPAHAFNWDVTLRVRQALTGLGVRTAMTRGNDNSEGPCGDERAKMANGLPVHPDAIVSIGAYEGSTSERGFTVFYPALPLDDSLAASDAKLARAIRDQLEASDIPPASDESLAGRSNLTLLNLAEYPAIQIGLANLINPDDATEAKSPAGRQRYADAVVRGLALYLGGAPK
jgi:serine/threonine protein kinase, bacterial